MDFINKLERKFGRFAVRNLIVYLLALQAIGYILGQANGLFYYEYLALNPAMVLRGQIWRLVTFLAVPASGNILLFAFSLFCFFSIARLMEQLIGTFRTNLYLLVGLLGIILGTFLVTPFYGSFLASTAAAGATTNLYLTMLLAIATLVPEAQFSFYGIIPIKAKWLGIFYGLLLAYQLFKYSWPSRIMLVMTLLNYILFFFLYHKPAQRAKQAKRKVVYQYKAHAGASGPRHRCAVCGRTELDDPTLEFRFCSKCEGNYEYCQDHLYTHRHVTKGNAND